VYTETGHSTCGENEHSDATQDAFDTRSDVAVLCYPQDVADEVAQDVADEAAQEQDDAVPEDLSEFSLVFGDFNAEILTSRVSDDVISINRGTFVQRLGEGADVPAQWVRVRRCGTASVPGDGKIGLLPKALLWPVPEELLHEVPRQQRTSEIHLEEKEELELQEEEKEEEVEEEEDKNEKKSEERSEEKSEEKNEEVQQTVVETGASSSQEALVDSESDPAEELPQPAAEIALPAEALGSRCAEAMLSNHQPLEERGLSQRPARANQRSDPARLGSLPTLVSRQCEELLAPAPTLEVAQAVDSAWDAAAADAAAEATEAADASIDAAMRDDTEAVAEPADVISQLASRSSGRQVWSF